MSASASRALFGRPASARRPHPRAHLLTVSTRERIPLLVIDPRTGAVVDRHVRHLHGRDLRVLAWSVNADHVLLLVVRPGHDRPEDLARKLRDRTTVPLSALGYPRPWAPETPVLPIRPCHDLAALVEYVLAAPVRAGLADTWPQWRWSGSRQWPDVSPAFLARHPSDRLWLDAVTAGGCGADGAPVGSVAASLGRTVERECLEHGG